MTRMLVLAGALALVACAGVGAPGHHGRIGAFEGAGDVGAVTIPGTVKFDRKAGTYAVTGAGANIWAGADAFQFVWKKMEPGDVHFAADFAWVGAGAIAHRKAGLMIRQSLAAGAPYVDVMLHGDGLTALQYREVENGPTYQIAANVIAPKRVRLEREGDYAFFSLAGDDGVFKHAGGNYRIKFSGPVYVGLAVSSHTDTQSETAVFSNVTLTDPKLPPITETGYPAKVESTIELLDIATGSRRIVHHMIGKLEAPNWSRDGKYLLFNSGGLLYKIALDATSSWVHPLTNIGAPETINTGALKKLNNDHGISPDGTMVAISDQSDPDRISRVYVMPIGGSDRPKLVASDEKGHSWWHAWTVDGKAVVFTGNRGRRNNAQEDYDLWTIPTKGGKERNITNSPGLDDGPDFSADGQWLYFNSTRSGGMQIWRTRFDGTGAERPSASMAAPPPGTEQVLNEPDRRDWFPHPSPDGKWIAYVSFGMDVTLNDHPPNRDVELRLIPADASASPRVLTKLFGGQGTINVPSWSPDSKQIAFVSYRLVR